MAVMPILLCLSIGIDEVSVRQLIRGARKLHHVSETERGYVEAAPHGHPGQRGGMIPHS